MTSRAAAAILGLIAGIAAALTTLSRWDALIAGVRAGSEGWAAPLPRLAWIIAISVSAFALVTLLIALIATLAEAWRTRAQIDRLRHDPMLEGWNAADWRAAFAGTAVADHAEAAIAAIIQGGDPGGEGSRRVFADPALLLNLERVWLDRGTLNATLKPLPNIVLAAGALLALLRYANAGAGWEIALADGLAGWTTITLARYVVRALLSPAIEMAVRSATAAIRPLTPALALDLVVKRLAPDPRNGEVAGTEVALGSMDADTMAAALRTALAEPLMRIAEAANRLQSGEITPGNQVTIRREEISTGPAIDIEAALAEVRMGIERLLDTPSASPAGPDLREIAETIRTALAEQNETLRQSSAALNDAADRIALSLSSISGGLPANNAASVIETIPSAANPAIASELKTLLREFGDR